MKKLKKNWLLIIIGMHIAFRIVLSSIVTNDEVAVKEYKTTAEIENDNQEDYHIGIDQQLVLLDKKLNRPSNIQPFVQ